MRSITQRDEFGLSQKFKKIVWLITTTVRSKDQDQGSFEGLVS